MSYKWRVSLKPHLSEEQRQQSPYKIAKELGMSKNTVIRYMESDEEIANYLSSGVGVLARYFNVNVHDIVSLVEVTDDEDSPSGQGKTLLPVSA